MVARIIPKNHSADQPNVQMNEIVSSTLWSRIHQLAKSARKKQAAVAYVTDDHHVKFGDGDTLITDASDGAIKAGQTDAMTLKRALNRGARIFSLDGLHAKVYVFDRVAVVGSANLSAGSRNLTEAACLTDQPSAVSMARSLINQLEHDGIAVDHAFIERISKLPVTKRRFAARSKRRSFDSDLPRTWLVGLQPREDDNDADEETWAEAEASRTDEESEISTITFRGKSKFRMEAKKGDLVIQIWTLKGRKSPSVVYHHAPILAREGHQDGRTCFLIEEFPDAEETALRWRKFQKLYHQIGISKTLARWPVREIAPHHADALHNLWFDK